MTNILRHRLDQGDTLFGGWLFTGSANNAAIMGRAGLDFLLIDQEHGYGEPSDVVACIRAAATAGTPCIVRSPYANSAWLKVMLDAGVQSLMFPMVDSAEDARSLVRSCWYPPHGTRGFASGSVRASGYGTNANYPATADANLLIIIQIESVEAIAAIPSIGQVEGVDALFIGINDLAASMGFPGRTDHPEVLAKVAEAEAAILATGKVMATLPSGGRPSEALFDKGHRLIVGTGDIGLLRDGSREKVQQFRKHMSSVSA